MDVEKTHPPGAHPMDAENQNDSSLAQTIPQADALRQPPNYRYRWDPVKAARIRLSHHNDRFFGGPWPEPYTPPAQTKRRTEVIRPIPGVSPCPPRSTIKGRVIA
jgi:hypothetical protein